MALTRAQRHFKIAEVLTTNTVTNQAQLVELLAKEGISVTQTTISRDLEDIGAIKVRLPGDISAYAVPEYPVKQVVPVDHLKRVLGEWVIKISVSQNLVVLLTPPGSAHVVASAVDRSGLEGVVGTVAGDDTVLLIASEEYGGHKLAQAIEEVSGIFLGKKEN